VVVLGEGLGLVPVFEQAGVSELDGMWWGAVPVCGDEGAAFDVDAFGFGLLAYAVEG